MCPDGMKHSLCTDTSGSVEAHRPAPWKTEEMKRASDWLAMTIASMICLVAQVGVRKGPRHALQSKKGNLAQHGNNSCLRLEL